MVPRTHALDYDNSFQVPDSGGGAKQGFKLLLGDDLVAVPVAVTGRLGGDASGGNDDDATCAFSGLQSSVTWTSVVGETYYIMVHGFSSGTGDFEVSIDCAVPVELQSFSVE